MSEMSGNTPVAPAPSGTSGEEQALRAAKDLLDQHAPWKQGVRWEVVLAQGIVLGILGVILWLAPGSGTVALQLLGVVLLASAVLSVWRLVRRAVAPGRIAIIAFRAGVGITSGLLTIMGTLLAGGTDENKIALAVVLGTGFLLYGIASAVAAFTGREKGAPFPILALLISATAAAVGLVLNLRANTGVDVLRTTFSTLGIVLVVAGLAIGGYALVLRNNATLEPEA